MATPTIHKLKTYKEFKARGEGTMLVKIAKIAQGATVKWKMKKKEAQAQIGSDNEKWREDKSCIAQGC